MSPVRNSKKFKANNKQNMLPVRQLKISNGVKSQYLTKSPSQTKKLGKLLAQRILKIKKKKRAPVLRLEGDLGGGKTTFLQGLARGLGIRQRVTSPTFVIMKKFKIPKKKYIGVTYANFYHIDCYRIEKPKEILNLGFKKIISNPQNIVAIEWAEKIRKIMPQNTIWLKFDFLDKNKRKITIKNG